MQQNQLFNQTRRRLALSYAGVMGLILTVLGVGVYRAIAHAHWVALDRELESVAGTLHDSLELKLEQPDRLEPIIFELLPNLCQLKTSCAKPSAPSPRHILSAVDKGNYYIRIFDTSGRLFAIGGHYPEGISDVFNPSPWQTLKDLQGNTYHQVSVSLHTRDRRDWGYFQVGRSLQDFEDYLGRVRWVLKLGLPLSLILVGGASWGLSGLAMRSIYFSYRQIQQFTADVAHELRTPLAASQATVESALRMPSLDEKEARLVLSRIERQNRRLIQLVSDLLLLARMDQQSAPIYRQWCCLNDLVNDLVEELTALAQASQIILIAEIGVEQSLAVMGDGEQLYRLVSNLIVNAIQYTPHQGTVMVRLMQADSQAVLQVQDTGTGIAAAEQNRIFDRFYRVQSDRSRQTGGSGLGLAIAWAIAQKHRGTLTIQSELGKGTVFTLQLPLSLNSRLCIKPIT